MPTISEPIGEAQGWNYRRVRAAFIAGHIGPATFLVSLQLSSCGRLSPRDAEAEVNLARMEIRQLTAYQRRKGER